MSSLLHLVVVGLDGKKLDECPKLSPIVFHAVVGEDMSMILNLLDGDIRLLHGNGGLELRTCARNLLLVNWFGGGEGDDLIGMVILLQLHHDAVQFGHVDNCKTLLSVKDIMRSEDHLFIHQHRFFLELIFTQISWPAHTQPDPNRSVTVSTDFHVHAQLNAEYAGAVSKHYVKINTQLFEA